MKLNPYLMFAGNCAPAFSFYNEQLGGQNLSLMPYRGSPMEEQVPEQARDRIMHASLQLGAQILMGSDCPPSQPYEGIKGCAMTITVETDAEAERVFNALAQNGKITMALDATFWASKFGMLTDQFGVAWMVMCERPQ